MGRVCVWTGILMALLTLVGSAGAREFWLAHEFRHFCAYPRIQKGYHYYKKGNYEKANHVPSKSAELPGEQ